MPDIQHYCHTCNVQLTVTRDGTYTVARCPRCDFMREYNSKSAAERQAKVRKKKKRETLWGTPDVVSGVVLIEHKTTRRGTIHARTTRCPDCLGLLKVINLSPTTARKGCLECRRKFDYIRTDTPEGRKLRVKQWREKKDATGTVIEQSS